ncbi:MAG: mechanosensitive ion channel family protein [Flavipsychrobacter sp.]
MLLLVSKVIEKNFWDYTYLGEKVSDYIWCAGIILGTLLLKKPLSDLMARISNSVTARFMHVQRESRLGTLMRDPINRLLQVILYYVALMHLDTLLDSYDIYRHRSGHKEVSVSVGEAVDHVFLFFFIIFLTQVLSRVIDYIYYRQINKAQHEHRNDRLQLLPLIKDMAKLLLWTISTFWILGSVFHVNIPALITGLGIGGVAIALAAKESVENLFAAFTILTDKPFNTGETIRLGDLEGAVERIGFRSTRMRASDGSAYIVPNQKLVGENLVNLSRRDTRGVKITVNIKYGIPHDTLEAMIAELKMEIKKVMHLIDPLEITIDTFGVNVLQLIISYHLPNPLDSETTLAAKKQEVNMLVYHVVSKYKAFSEVASGEVKVKEG